MGEGWRRARDAARATRTQGTAKTTRRSSPRWTLVEGVTGIPVGEGSGYVRIHRLARRTIRGENLLLGIAGAFSAYGLVGSEHNGIFLLNESKGEVVLDRDTEVGSGFYGAAPSQLRQYERLQSLGPDDFLRWALEHPRCRGDHTLPAPLTYVRKGGKP